MSPPASQHYPSPHLQIDKSSVLQRQGPPDSHLLESTSPNKPQSSDIASDQLESPVSPALPDEVIHASLTDDVMAWKQVLEVFSEPASISLDEIRDAQSTDDSLQPVMQALRDLVQPPHRGIQEFPEDARILLSQWNSVVLQDGVLYRRFHYLDGTTNFLQIVLPTKIRHPYIERLLAHIGHFERAKTCMAVSRRTYFPGWWSCTGLLVRNCATFNLHQQGHQMPCQATLKPMKEFCPMAELYTDLVGPLLEGRNS